MHFNLPSMAAILALTNLVIASPLLHERQDSTSSDTVTPPDRYYLQTKVIGDNKDSGTNKDGLYLYSYHTGAGLGDIGLSNVTTSWVGYLNGTQQLFTYPNAPYPWPMNVQLYGPYQEWFLTTISVSSQPAAGSPGYFFNSSGLQYNSSEIAGWLACDWWHGVPQLFALGSYYQPGRLSSACSQVELHPIATTNDK